MITIGNRDYPETIDGVLAKPALIKMLRDILRKGYDINLLDFYEAKFDPKTMYRRFFAENSRETINVSGAVFDAAHALEGKWDDGRWADVIDDARSEIAARLKHDAIHRMYTSKEFKAYHAAQGGRERRVDDEATEEPDRLPPKIVRVAKRIGIADAEGLRIYIAALSKHGAERVRPVAQKLLKDNGVTLKVATFNEFLFRGGFATRADVTQPEPLGATPPKVTLNRRTLGVCGFGNMRTDKAFSRIRTFVLAMERKDKRSAEVVFAKILKDEPIDSVLHGDKMLDLFKRMKKRKAFEIVQ